MIPARTSDCCSMPMRGVRRNCAKSASSLQAPPGQRMPSGSARRTWAWRDQVTYVARPNVEELVRLYQQASVFALPSDEEGFGMVVLEAMGLWCPRRFHEQLAAPTASSVTGRTGTSCRWMTLRPMAKRLEALLCDPALNRQMGQKARLTVEARFEERIAGAVFCGDVGPLAREGRGQLMCGLIAAFSRIPLREAAARRALDRLARRGPDGEGPVA